ncbi:lipopolysaccharide biosynthesis protein [Christiangramia crocea]|uniref:Lipopolysaccharide biosynthesis protein n=1 Tax=Christiangramia crocea TaxID=2904124 RepID=A0A9X1UVY1_9FLAO|nr:lipopolysaccharide biosynthesis protein [Gramella crocea]MCG9970429.1 lipopolysaccharide biosynthesis protein [Gramella crocea]
MTLRNQARAGMVWTFAQQFGNQIVGFGVSLVLARVLMPEEFGLIGMIAIFISVGQTMVQSGLTQSLIRAQHLENADYSTVFYFNLITSLVIYFLIYQGAPYIADFYDQPILISLTRLYCIVFIINGFSAVQQARFTRNLNFKIQTIITLPATIIGGGIGIALAYLDYGVWSLVWSQIVMSFVSAILFWIFSSWRPNFSFSLKLFKKHFSFGFKLAASGLLNTLFNNAYLIIIGKFFAPAQVGYFTRAETMKQLPIKNLSSALNKVTYPLFSKIQEDDVRLKDVYSRLMKLVLFIIAPTMVLLSVIAEPLFRFLFTAKWLPAVPYFQILCIVGILYPINAYNLNVLKVKGRSDLFLKLEIIKKIIITLVIVSTIPFGIYALLWGQVIIALAGFFINSQYTGRFISYSAIDQTKDLIPILIFAGLAGLSCYMVDFYLLKNFKDIIRIIAGMLNFGVIYLPLSYAFEKKLYEQLRILVFNK